MLKLGVNIDHVATLRQVRRVTYPNVLEAALAAERGGADGITVHLREDRRHIQDVDVEVLRAGITTKLNLEMAATAEMVRKACTVRPRDVCLVPERREELTTEGGLDVAGNRAGVGPVVRQLRDVGIRVSLFIDPDVSQIEAAREMPADAIEIHTGAFAEARDPERQQAELQRILVAAGHAHALGLIVNAGHGLTLDNVASIAAIPVVQELNIGHSIVADALFVGMEEAVRQMKARMHAARGG
jgi:pyridoxine 5-phosphate synthase